MRTTLITFHRWLALITSIIVLVLAVTGSAMVFEGAIDRALNPGLWYVTPQGSPLSLDTLAARARAVAGSAPITGFAPNRQPDQAATASAGVSQIFLDPYTGRVLGTRTAAEFNKTLPRRLHVLHTTLMAGERGGTIVALVTVAAFILVLTGIVLWWPDKLWRVRWSASWKRVNFDLHHALGIGAAVVLLVITASGLVIHYRTLDQLMYKLDSTPRPRPPAQPTAEAGSSRISLDSLARVGASSLPGASTVFLQMPPKGDQPYIVAMRFPEDRTPGGRSRVWVDRYRGTVLRIDSTRDAQPGTRLANVMRSVHTGDLLGKPTEVVWLFAALVLATQAISGVLMWWNARGARAAKARAG